MTYIIYSPLVVILMLCAALALCGLWQFCYHLTRYLRGRHNFQQWENRAEVDLLRLCKIPYSSTRFNAGFKGHF